MSEPAYIAPRLTLRVGVTGHRADKLAGADLDLLRCRAAEVLTCLAAVTHKLQAANDAKGDSAPFSSGDPVLRLATPVAEGADRIVAEAAIEAGYALNLVLPFPRALYASDFDAEGRAAFERLIAHKATQSVTELDLASAPQDPEAYAAAGRLTLDHSDVLIAIWDKAPAAGPGGTAEVVEEAHRRGLPVVLIQPTGELEIWNVPETASDPVSDGKWELLKIATEGDLCSNNLATAVEALIGFPKPEPAKQEMPLPQHLGERPDPADCLRRFKEERLRAGSGAFGYNLFRRVFIGKAPFSLHVDNGLERERAEAWSRTQEAAQRIGGAEFKNNLEIYLRARWIAADNLAVHYSHRFRTAFITNFTFAALAVFVGLLIVLVPSMTPQLSSPDNEYYETFPLHVKFALVLLELFIIGTILWNTKVGRRQQWRDRWLDYRILAEALRPARLAVLIGSSPVRPDRSVGATPGQSFISWYVAASLREIPPPTASLGEDALAAGLDVAIDEELASQIDYHIKNEANLRRLDHNLESAAEHALWATVAAGGVYIAAYAAFIVAEVKAVAKALKPLATLLGGTLPVIGAAIFGIRATGEFRAAKTQSKRMVAELTKLKAKLEAKRDLMVQSDRPPLPHLRPKVRQLLAQVSRAMAEDLRVWGMIFSERDLESGF